jgi:hypothetical protein
MLSTQNLKLLNQPSKKFRSRYIGPYKILEEISSQAYKFELPTNMKVHTVFYFGLLKYVFSVTPTIEIVDDILTSNYFVYGDDHYHVHSLVDHKISPHPQTYGKDPALLFGVIWEGYDSSEDSWEPYINVKRTDCFDDYLKTSDKFCLLLLSDEYKRLSSSYPSRFPRTLRAIINS